MLKHLRTLRRTLSVVLLALPPLLSGCSTMYLPEHTAPAPSQFPDRQQVGNLEIGVRPFTGKSELNRYFGMDLLKAGLIPILVSARNAGDAGSYVLSSERFTLGEGTGDTGALEGRDAGGVTTANAGIGSLFVVPVLGPFLILGGVNSMSKAREIEHGAVVNGLYDRTVSPGESVDGFVYMNLADAEGAQRTSAPLRIEVLDLGTMKWVPVEFELSWEGR